MSSQKPKPTVNLIDKISPKDLEKIKAYQSGTESSHPVDASWMLLAEFAQAFGWQAYLEARDDKIPSSEMHTLLEAKRKLDALRHYEMAEAMLIGAGSVNTKRPYATFKKLTKHIINRIKVD